VREYSGLSSSLMLCLSSSQERVPVVVTAERRATRATPPIFSLYGGCHALGGRLVRGGLPALLPSMYAWRLTGRLGWRPCDANRRDIPPLPVQEVGM
jgi:hypothetical protein